MNLVYHVCREAPGLESLFLISKSNCAFANFKDEAACAAAQFKIHDSRFHTVRLVSRLRRVSTTPVGESPIPTGPAALSTSQAPVATTPSPSSDSNSHPAGLDDRAGDLSSPKDKFFIVKSLTVEDLELSVRNGIWATQSHNEEALNKAYQVCLHLLCVKLLLTLNRLLIMSIWYFLRTSQANTLVTREWYLL